MSGELIDLSPLYRLDVPNDTELTEAVLAREGRELSGAVVSDQRRAAVELTKELVYGGVERLREPPDCVQCGVGLVILDPREERLRDP